MLVVFIEGSASLWLKLSTLCFAQFVPLDMATGPSGGGDLGPDDSAV